MRSVWSSRWHGPSGPSFPCLPHPGVAGGPGRVKGPLCPIRDEIIIFLSPGPQGQARGCFCQWPVGALPGFLRGVSRVLFLPSYLVPPSLHCRNAEKILGYLNSNVLSRDLIPPHVNFSHLTTKDYSEMYNVIMTVKEKQFSALGLDPCLLEDELDKVLEQAALSRTERNTEIGLVAGAWKQALKDHRE